jgi:SHS2 domain-containing protein
LTHINAGHGPANTMPFMQPKERTTDIEVAGGCCGYFNHNADIGVIGRGLTLEEAFEAAAVLTFALMTDLSAVRREHCERIEFEEADVELALVRWLNLLLAAARAHDMVFAEFRLERDGVVWRGSASGEAWCTTLVRRDDVKEATLSRLKVAQTETGWEARCTVIASSKRPRVDVDQPSATHPFLICSTDICGSRHRYQRMERQHGYR